jgi:regulator of sigma E protease
MLTLLIFILTLSILVLVHEFGHYIVAKKNGIRVEEFGLGLPPRILSKQFGETLYSLNLLPFGGFVKLTGEDPDEEDVAALENDPKSFSAKKPRQRAAVLVAGVTMNFILAVSVFYIFLGWNNFSSYEFPLFFDYTFRFGETVKAGTVVTEVAPESPAEKAGLEFGEAIVTIDGVPVNGVEDVKKELAGKLEQDVTVVLADIKNREANSQRTVTLQPMVNEQGEEVLGVYLGEFVAVRYSSTKDKLLSGFFHAYNMSAYSMKAFGSLISYSFETKDFAPVSSSVAGPVGIYQLVGGILTLDTKQAILSLLDFVGIMSMSLAIINLLPLPALDGGRVLFILIEIIRGKGINPKTEATVHRYGMIALMGLLALITLKDLFL